MKKIIFTAFLFMGIAGFAMGQTKKTTKSKSTNKSTQHKTSSQGHQAIDSSKHYMWKDGQEATPTGHDATGVNGDHARATKDTARKRSKG
jgi:hypothetical protein